MLYFTLVILKYYGDVFGGKVDKNSMLESDQMQRTSIRGRSSIMDFTKTNRKKKKLKLRGTVSCQLSYSMTG